MECGIGVDLLPSMCFICSVICSELLTVGIMHKIDPGEYPDSPIVILHIGC